MAEFWVTHSLNLTKAVKFNVALRYFGVLNREGEQMWVLEVGTTYPAIDGSSISAKKILDISHSNLDDVIEEMTAELCAQIDWSPYSEDRDAPYVIDIYPSDGSTNVSIESVISFKIKEVLPAAGIDISSMRVVLNNSEVDFDITSEVTYTGDPYEYTCRWSPPKRVYSTYD